MNRAETFTFKVAGADVSLSAGAIADLWIEKARIQSAPRVPGALRIGDVVNGQAFMGIVRGDDGAADYRLWDLGEASERLNHADATKWAEGMGASLPTRREQSVMFGNRGEGQYKAEWYWSCEQYAGNADYAWMQSFAGGQLYDPKSDGCRARAVRREPIQ